MNLSLSKQIPNEWIGSDDNASKRCMAVDKRWNVFVSIFICVCVCVWVCGEITQKNFTRKREPPNKSKIKMKNMTYTQNTYNGGDKER